MATCEQETVGLRGEDNDDALQIDKVDDKVSDKVRQPQAVPERWRAIAAVLGKALAAV